MAKKKMCPFMLSKKSGEPCEEQCPNNTNENCEIIEQKTGWKKLASHKWPMERYAERQASRCAGYLSNSVLDGLAPTEKELVQIEVKMYLLRALKYGQRHGSGK